VTGRSKRLRRATVQVCDLEERIVGTAFLISSAPWRVMTCEHVVAAAGVPVSAPAGAELIVRFPEARPPEVRHAFVAARPGAPYEDDAVILELKSPEPPVLPEHVLSLEAAEEPDGHEFVSYGFRRLGKYEGALAEGRIQGHLPPPSESTLACEPIQISSAHIDRGMSGAPLLDSDDDRVVGIIAEAYYAPEGIAKDRDTAWAIDGRILEFVPADARPGEENLAPIESPQVGDPLTPALQGPLDWHLHLSPPPATPLVGREDALEWLNDQWQGGASTVAVVEGPSGCGKTALVRQWIVTLEEADGRPEGLFWWGFAEVPDPDEFFASALDFFSGGTAPPSMAKGPGRALLLAAYAVDRRTLLVLDGVDAVEDRSAQEIDELIDLLAGRDPGGSLCVATVRSARDQWRSCAHVLELGPLDPESAIDLIEREQVAPQTASAIAASAGNPLVARLLAQSADPAESAALAGEVVEEDRLEATVLERASEFQPGESDLLLALSLMRRPLPLAWSASLEVALESWLEDWEVDVPRALEMFVQAGLADTFEAEQPVVSVHEAIATAVVESAGDRTTEIHPALADMWWDHRKFNELTGEQEWRPAASLAELRPAIETVHHLCRAGSFEEAFERLWEGVYRHTSYALVNQLGEWTVDLDLVSHFFPDGDLAAEPLVEDKVTSSILLNEAGLDLRNVGRPRESLEFFTRAVEAGNSAGVRHIAIAAMNRQAETMLELGDLAGAQAMAESAVEAATEDGDAESRWYAHATLALPIALQGSPQEALEHYSQARRIREPKIFATPQEVMVRWWAGQMDETWELWNQAWMAADWERDRENMALLLRLRGEMWAVGDPDEALEPLEEAFRRASELVAVQPLIEASTAFGAGIAASEDLSRLDEAQALLQEAIRLIESSGWSGFEPRARIALAHVAFRQDKLKRAERHLLRAAVLAEESHNVLDLALVARLRSEDRDLSQYSLGPTELPEESVLERELEDTV
jgi:tetratricopeptide (TPR) repeat protein